MRNRGENLNTKRTAKLRIFAFVGFLAIALRQITGLIGLIGPITNEQATAGCIVAGIGFFMYHYELAKGYGIDGKRGIAGLGGPVINGATVVGISLYFFGATFLKGVAIMAIFALVFYLLSLLMGRQWGRGKK